MMLFLKLAWRNIWRNKRRTMITMFSIILAVLLSAVTRSMQLGSYDQMIENSAGQFSGYLQVHRLGYQDESTLNNSFEATDSLMQAIASTEEVKTVVPRLQSYALAAGRKNSRPAMLIGFDPQAEKELSRPDEKLVDGRYPRDRNAKTVLVSQGLAEYLHVAVGDTLVLLGQGYHGVSAADAYPIGGIVKFGLPQLDRGLVYLPLGTAQYFFGATGRLTAAAIVMDQARGVDEVQARLRSKLDTQRYEVLTWRQLMPELVQAIEADSGSGMILLLVLYVVVGFGIFGTVLMMTAERKFEFGIMISIGTHRLRLGLILMLELFLLALMGIILGGLASMPVIWYFHLNPISFSGEAAQAMIEYGMEPVMPFSTDPVIMIQQGLIVLAIASVISLYPLWHALRLDPIEAMSS